MEIELVQERGEPLSRSVARNLEGEGGGKIGPRLGGLRPVVECPRRLDKERRPLPHQVASHRLERPSKPGDRLQLLVAGVGQIQQVEISDGLQIVCVQVAVRLQ